jgi:hypothetical protein
MAMAAQPKAPAATTCRRVRRPALLRESIGISLELGSNPESADLRSDASIPASTHPVHGWRAGPARSVLQITYEGGVRTAQPRSLAGSVQQRVCFDQRPHKVRLACDPTATLGAGISTLRFAECIGDGALIESSFWSHRSLLRVKYDYYP